MNIGRWRLSAIYSCRNTHDWVVIGGVIRVVNIVETGLLVGSSGTKSKYLYLCLYTAMPYYILQVDGGYKVQ